MVSKHNLNKRIQNFFKLFHEFLNVNLNLSDLLKQENLKLESMKEEPILRMVSRKKSK